MRAMQHGGPGKRIVLVRHGETEWSKSGQHTGRTDIPLTEEGRRRAAALGAMLEGMRFDLVLSSPLGRARETCELAGFGGRMQLDPDLMEWDYGIYEGRTTLEIRKEDPAWSVWLSEIHGGERLEAVYERAQRVIGKVARAEAGETVALFAHGHILRILAAAWIGMPAITGRYLALDTATVSVLGYERQTRVIRQWNVADRGLLA